MREKRWKDNKGFTLIEIVITTVVLATISIPLLAYFTDSMRHSARTKEQQNAVVAAQDAVEELKIAPYSLDADKVVGPTAAPKDGWNFQASMPVDAAASYEMYKNYSVNGKSYNVVAKIQPKKEVAGVYNATTDAYDKNLKYHEAMIPSMDSSKDVISTETSRYFTNAKRYFLELYNMYCTDNNLVKDTANVNMNSVNDRVRKKIIIYFKQGTETDTVLVSVTYSYTYVRDAADYYPQAVLDANPTPYEQVIAQESIKKAKLENIFIFYNPDKKQDEVEITAAQPSSVLGISNLKLYLIAESSVASQNATPADVASTEIQVRDASYQMIASTDTNMSMAVTEVYTNLANKSFDEMATSGNLYSKVQKDTSGLYSMIIKEDFNRLADITVTVYRDHGGTYPFNADDKLAAVDGNKVQK